jgi:transposase
MNVIRIEPGSRIILVTGMTDMRKNSAGLSMIAHNICLSAYESNGVFIFRGKSAHKIKILFWDGNGFCMLHKSIDGGKFFWVNTDENPYMILSHEQFVDLMRGQIWQNYSAKNPPKSPG